MRLKLLLLYNIHTTYGRIQMQKSLSETSMEREGERSVEFHLFLHPSLGFHRLKRFSGMEMRNASGRCSAGERMILSSASLKVSLRAIYFSTSPPSPSPSFVCRLDVAYGRCTNNWPQRGRETSGVGMPFRSAEYSVCRLL